MMKKELIETLWNVNSKSLAARRKQVVELIETLWNVNLKNCVNFFGRLRINRNIVECKY